MNSPRKPQITLGLQLPKLKL